jgi:hypothetical protein
MSTMKCRECLERFSALSADQVSASSALSVREHLAACEQCQHEWQRFERTLFVLSTSSQPLPAAPATEAMWLHCADYIFQKTEAGRGNRAAPQLTFGLRGWATRQPGWSWATLGGALAILGAAWLLAPHDEALMAPDTDLGRSASMGTLVTFERPSPAASGLVNHHSAMAADPFADSVGSTLVSYSATSPLSRP